jgi:APA family basic amino acid/polyamine antiporter
MVNYEKKLEYIDLLNASIGHIIGAGIFTLIAYVNNHAKEKTWISLLLGGLFMTIFSRTYSELPKKYESDDNIEQNLITNKFSKNTANIILLLAVVGFIFGAYLVAKSFGEYFSDIFNISSEISTLLIIGICFFLNIYKIDLLADFNNVITFIGLGILIILILIGFYKIIIDRHNIDFKKYYTFTDYTDFKKNIWNILKGAYLILFAYLGFEILIKLNKESVNPKKDIPNAINHSMIIVIIIYTLLGIVYSYSMNLKKKYSSKDIKQIPMTNSLELLTGTDKYNKIINICACIFTANTVLISMLGASRLLDDVINIDKAPQQMIHVGLSPNVPRKAILIITLGMLILFYLKYSIEKSTYISNTFTLVLFGSVLYSIKK